VKQILKKLLIIAVVLTVPAVYFFFDARKGLFPQCPFYFVTGFHCPGCGSQRALSALLHGDILQSLNYNLLMVFSLPLVIYSATVAVVNGFRNEKIVQRFFYSPMFVKVVLAVVIIFFIARNIPVYPFSLLAPHIST
jgi:predicted membrane protein